MDISRTSRIPNKDQCPTQLSNNRFNSSYNSSNRLLNRPITLIRRNLFKLRRLNRNSFKLNLFNNLRRFNMFSNLLKPSLLNNLLRLSHFNSRFLNPSRFSRTSFLNLSTSSRSNSCLSKQHNLKRSKRKSSPRLRFRHPLLLIPSLLSLEPRLSLKPSPSLKPSLNLSSSSNLLGRRISTIPIPPTLIRTFKLGHNIMLKGEGIWPVLCISSRFLD